MRAWLLTAALVAMPFAALAQTSPIHVEHAWSRAAPQGRTGALYMTVTTQGPADRLTGVSTPVASRAELHESMNEAGVAKMRPVDGLPVSAGKPLTLAPGGYHVMLIGLKQTLKEGEHFPVTLTFEKAGAVTASATVEKAGAAMPAQHGAMPMEHAQPD